MNNTIKARVTEVHKSKYFISYEGNDYSAVLSGKLLYLEEFPVVGDYVEAVIYEGSDSLITSICERKSFIARPDRGGHADVYVKTMKEQAMVANIDYCFIFASLNHDFSANRIVRYAATVSNGGGKPVVILSKADLCNNKEEYAENVKSMYPKAAVYCVSSYTGEGLDEIKKYFVPGTTIALMGSSGAGKSTLVNTIAGREVMRVSEIREEDSKGRHTTTHRQLVEVDGVYIIDTPGMRELGVCDVTDGLEATFDDIVELEGQCRFSNCSHTKEPGCAIIRAIRDGELSSERWETYVKLQAESNWSKSMKACKMTNIAIKRRELNNKKK